MKNSVSDSNLEEQDLFAVADRELAHRQSQATDDSQATPQISTFAAISELIWGPATTSAPTMKSAAYDYKQKSSAEEASCEEQKDPCTPQSAAQERLAYLEGQSTSLSRHQRNNPQVLHQLGSSQTTDGSQLRVTGLVKRIQSRSRSPMLNLAEFDGEASIGTQNMKKRVLTQRGIRAKRGTLVKQKKQVPASSLVSKGISASRRQRLDSDSAADLAEQSSQLRILAAQAQTVTTQSSQSQFLFPNNGKRRQSHLSNQQPLINDESQMASAQLNSCHSQQQFFKPTQFEDESPMLRSAQKHKPGLSKKQEYSNGTQPCQQSQQSKAQRFQPRQTIPLTEDASCESSDCEVGEEMDERKEAQRPSIQLNSYQSQANFAIPQDGTSSIVGSSLQAKPSISTAKKEKLSRSGTKRSAVAYEDGLSLQQNEKRSSQNQQQQIIAGVQYLRTEVEDSPVSSSDPDSIEEAKQRALGFRPVSHLQKPANSAHRRVNSSAATQIQKIAISAPMKSISIKKVIRESMDTLMQTRSRKQLSQIGSSSQLQVHHSQATMASGLQAGHCVKLAQTVEQLHRSLSRDIVQTNSNSRAREEAGPFQMASTEQVLQGSRKHLSKLPPKQSPPSKTFKQIVEAKQRFESNGLRTQKKVLKPAKTLDEGSIRQIAPVPSQMISERSYSARRRTLKERKMTGKASVGAIPQSQASLDLPSAILNEATGPDEQEQRVQMLEQVVKMDKISRRIQKDPQQSFGQKQLLPSSSEQLTMTFGRGNQGMARSGFASSRLRAQQKGNLAIETQDLSHHHSNVAFNPRSARNIREQDNLGREYSYDHFPAPNSACRQATGAMNSNSPRQARSGSKTQFLFSESATWRAPDTSQQDKVMPRKSNLVKKSQQAVPSRNQVRQATAKKKPMGSSTVASFAATKKVSVQKTTAVATHKRTKTGAGNLPVKKSQQTSPLRAKSTMRSGAAFRQQLSSSPSCLLQVQSQHQQMYSRNSAMGSKKSTTLGSIRKVPENTNAGFRSTFKHLSPRSGSAMRQTPRSGGLNSGRASLKPSNAAPVFVPRI